MNGECVICGDHPCRCAKVRGATRPSTQAPSPAQSFSPGGEISHGVSPPNYADWLKGACRCGPGAIPHIHDPSVGTSGGGTLPKDDAKLPSTRGDDTIHVPGVGIAYNDWAEDLRKFIESTADSGVDSTGRVILKPEPPLPPGIEFVDAHANDELRGRIPILPDRLTETQAAEMYRDARPDLVNHPPHYKSGGIETIDFIEAKKLGFHAGNVIKYISRYQHKGGVEDLRKAAWYLNRLIDRESDKTPMKSEEREKERRLERLGWEWRCPSCLNRYGSSFLMPEGEKVDHAAWEALEHQHQLTRDAHDCVCLKAVTPTCLECPHQHWPIQPCSDFDCPCPLSKSVMDRLAELEREDG